jgi:predicted transcriptional regulator
MDQQNNKRLVLTSVNQIITLVNTNPAIAQAIPRLIPLTTMRLSEAPKKSCNCGAKKNVTTIDVNKQLTETILTSLSNNDFHIIKKTLDLNQLCYYKRNLADNSLELICV